MNSKTRVFNDKTTFINFINEVLDIVEYDSSDNGLATRLSEISKKDKSFFYCNDRKSLAKMKKDLEELNNNAVTGKLIFVYNDRVNSEKNKNNSKELFEYTLFPISDSDGIEDTTTAEGNQILLSEIINELGRDNEILTNTKIDELIKKFKISYINTMKVERLINNSNLENKVNEDDFDRYNEIILTKLSSINQSALVLGAGISVDAGAAKWKDMMDSFKFELKSRNITTQPSVLQGVIGDTNLINAQMFKEVLNNDDDYFNKIQENLYGGMKDFSDQILIYYVCKLINKWKNNNFFRVMTYNFDNYLEKYLDRFYRNCKYHVIFTPERLNNNLNIYHVHGFLPDKKISDLSENEKESIILTEDDYNKLYNDAYAWQIGTQLSFFRENICLFIGCGLTDPNIRRLLKMSSSKGYHFAIMNGGNLGIDNKIIATNHFYNLGVRIIWVNDFAHYRDVVKIMAS